MKDLRISVIPLDRVIFPYETGNVDLSDESKITVLKAAARNDERVAVCPKRPHQRVEEGDVVSIITIDQIMCPSASRGKLFYKAEPGKFILREVIIEKNGEITATLEKAEYSDYGTETDSAEILILFNRANELYQKFQEAIGRKGILFEFDSINGDIDAIVSKLEHADRFRFFGVFDTKDRLINFISALTYELEILEIEEGVAQSVKDSIDENQRDYYVREQIKALNAEIGEEDEGEEYLEKIDALATTEENKERLRREVTRMRRCAPASPDMAIQKNYLDTALELPWGVYTEDNEDLKQAERVLNEDHYGITKVKERLLEALAVRKLSKGGRSPIICLVGPPGIGKTSIAASIARAMNKKYVRLSFGGVRDEAEIRGHRKTYVGAMPGRIVTGIKTAGSMNPVFLMDEIDKMASDYKGDPASALLEVLDPEQNNNFRDHFLEIPFDLSKVLFITTANTTETISRPLLDRMEVIEMSGYTELEKLEIAKRYLVAKAIKQCGVEPKWVKISDDALIAVIRNYTRESGVRALEKSVNAIIRKVAKRFVEKPKSRTIRVTAENLNEFLGEPKYLDNKRRVGQEKCVVTGLAWTEVGGDTLEVEVAFTKGKGEILLTGNLGDVMKESARIALSYCRSRAEEWGVAENFFKEHDIHIHVPDGAVPKDGPSAGITLATALASALADKFVKENIAMTGELTLRGRVLPIGGLKEKSLAALRDGVKTVFLPEENRKDYRELPDTVKNNIEFVFVDNVDTVLKSALIW